MRRRLIISPLLIFSLAIAGLAQTKPRLTPADYGRWERLGSTNLSPDGKWLAYGVPEAFSSGFDSAAQQGGDDAFQFFLREVSFDNRWVIDAPFSADAVTEMNQILPDGKRIVQRVEGRVYRDSQGRTRNERTFHVEGSSEQKQTITIHDPLIHVSYTFDPETKIARKMNTYIKQIDTPPQPPPSTVVPLPLRASVYSEATANISDLGGVLSEKAIRRVQPEYPPIAKAAGASGAVQVDITISQTGEVVDAEVHSGHLLLRDAAVQAARQWLFKPTEIGGVPVIVHGILTFNFMLNDQKNASAPIARSVTNYTINTEQLGEQMVEGVECEGTRTVTTIPAGVIGNENPIETVIETWGSRELRMIILSKRSDPRFGEFTYRVTSIIRSETDATLFQIPSGYTIIDSGARKIEVDREEYKEMRRKLKEQSKVTRQSDNQ